MDRLVWKVSATVPSVTTYRPRDDGLSSYELAKPGNLDLHFRVRPVISSTAIPPTLSASN